MQARKTNKEACKQRSWKGLDKQNGRETVLGFRIRTEAGRETAEQVCESVRCRMFRALSRTGKGSETQMPSSSCLFVKQQGLLKEMRCT